MRRQTKVWTVLLLMVLVTSYAAAAQKPAVQKAGPSTQLFISGLDVITASDAGGGYLSTRDLLVMIAVGVGIVILILVL
jgi:hypothetical protein